MSMNKDLSLDAVVEGLISGFHQRRLESLEGVKLDKVLSRKNPYLFRAKNILTADELVRGILDAHLSSQEEGLFGGVLENIALHVASGAYGGKKSSAEGIDLEFDREGTRHLLSIKSGPNWGNSDQIKKMRDNFKKAKKILRTNVSKTNVVCINGCCYGRTTSADQGDYLKLCGQEFWEKISGSDTLYIDIIKPIAHKAKQKNESFHAKYSEVVNRLVRDLTNRFCDEQGRLLWEEIVRFASSKKA